MTRLRVIEEGAIGAEVRAAIAERVDIPDGIAPLDEFGLVPENNMPFLYALADGKRLRVYTGTEPPANSEAGQLWLDPFTTTPGGILKVFDEGVWEQVRTTPSAGSVTTSRVSDANLDGTATTPSMRTLGTGSRQAASGNHGHDSSYYPKTESDARYLKLSGGSMSGLLDLSADPTSPLHAATKQYVDAARAGLDLKPSVRAASTANVDPTTGGLLTVDGVVLAAGDRVLVKNQTTASQNGIYVAASGAWSRATDADSSSEMNAGMFTFIEEGTTQADQGWVLVTNDPITLGTTPLSFTVFTGAGTATPDATESTPGKSEFATNAEIQAAIDNAFYRGLSVSAFRLKQELDRRAAHGPWITPTFLNGWTNLSGYAPVGYRKEPSGTVVLRGHPSGGSNAAPAFILPAGYRPLASLIFPTPLSAGAQTNTTRIEVQPDGTVVLYGGGATWFSLNAVRFQADQ